MADPFGGAPGADGDRITSKSFIKSASGLAGLAGGAAGVVIGVGASPSCLLDQFAGAFADRSCASADARTSWARSYSERERAGGLVGVDRGMRPERGRQHRRQHHVATRAIAADAARGRHVERRHHVVAGRRPGLLAAARRSAATTGARWSTRRSRPADDGGGEGHVRDATPRTSPRCRDATTRISCRRSAGAR